MGLFYNDVNLCNCFLEMRHMWKDIRALLADSWLLNNKRRAPSFGLPAKFDKFVYLGGALLFVAVSAALFLLNTRIHIGILPDTTRYMRLGPEPYDAPMYTWFLDAFVLAGIDATTGAKMLGLALVCVNPAIIWYLLMRSTNSWPHAATGTALVVFSPHFVSGHAVAMSEPLFIFLLFCSFLILLGALGGGSRKWVAGAGLLVALAMLTRFTALPFGVAMAACLLINPGKPVKQRIIDAAVFGASSGAVFLGWVAASKLSTGQATGRDLSFYGNADAERWMSGLDTLTALLMPVQVPLPLRVAVLLFVIVCGVWLWMRYAREVLSRAPAGTAGADAMIGICLGLFVPLYLAFMILAVSMEANLPLNGRYALPLYVATVMAITIAVAKRRVTGGTRNYASYALAAAAALILAGHITRTADRTRDAFANGIGYGSVAWTASPIIQAVNSLPPDAAIFSNAPDAINYLTSRKTLFIPFLFHRRTGLDNPDYPYEHQLRNMVSRLQNGNGYVVFLDGVDWRFFLPAEADLAKGLNLSVIKETPDGRIYALRVKSPNES
jgi:4-amino-4-deoxy-L-arabinose transferase-like glycosyltransferase